jgi:signal transduction histidine kinase
MTRNKKINDAVNGIIHNVFSLAASGRRRSLSHLSGIFLTSHLAQVNSQLLQLKELAKDDPELMQSVKVCEVGIVKAQQDIVDARSALEKAESADKAVEIFKTYRRLIDDDLQQSVQAGLIDLAERLEKGTGDERGRMLREQIRTLLKVALGVSILFAILAGYLYSRNFAVRLARLQENSMRLAKAEELLPQVDGTDEIAELDKGIHHAGVLIAEAIQMRQEVTSMITHDLKTPLQSIGFFLQMLDQGMFGEVNEKGRNLLSLTDQESKRMLQLIESILQLEKLRSGAADLQSDIIDIATTLDRSVNAIEFLAISKEIEIQRQYGPANIRGDAFWLEQVFVNILSNAVKYSPKNSIVRVATKTTGGRLEVTIADNGQGISEQDQKRIFQKFHRIASTSHAASGTGLGLTIAKELIELQSGTIEVESKPGQGSIFTISLPIRGA